MSQMKSAESSANKVEWIPRRIKFVNINVPIMEEVQDHPLKSATSSMTDGPGLRRGTLRSTSTSSSTRTPTPIQTPAQTSNDFITPLTSHSTLDGSDPLSQFAIEELDPLTKMAADEWDYEENVTTIINKKRRDEKKELLDLWSSRRENILNKYTKSGSLKLSMGQNSRRPKVGNQLPENMKNPLEQLDHTYEDSSSTELLSQQKYTERLEQLNNELVQAWNSDQRVKGLKIAIQAAKLLHDSSDMEFYPSKFILVTDILDNLGQLVYNRLKVKSETPKTGSKVAVHLPENFSPDMVPENVRETCQNWFYKIASIRELIPRLYIEMAIIKSYSFLKNSDIPATLLRITRMIRGIGDPLVAIYARCYLCRVGLAVSQVCDLSFVKENFLEFLSIYQELFNKKTKVVSFEYINLYIPALEWIIQIISATSSDEELQDIFKRCKEQDNNELLLNVILSSYKRSFIAANISVISDWIDNSDKDVFPKYVLYQTLGECILKEISREVCDSLCSNVNKFLCKLNDIEPFLSVVETWIRFASIHNPMYVQHFVTHLKKRIKGISEGLYIKKCHTQMQVIIEKLVTLSEVKLSMNEILPLIDLYFEGDNKVEIVKTILEGVSTSPGPITSPIMIDAIMTLMKMIHDSVSIFTVDDEKRQISILISSLIQRVDYGRNFEKQLDFYVETRASFPNLDLVHVQVVQCVNRLAIDTRKIVRGHHTRRTSSFVRACVAFCFITIPSLTSVRTRLQLYLLSGQVALSNQCLEQADACFKAALSLVPEMPKTIDIDGREKSSEPYLLAYLSSFLSTLLVVPDSPEHGVLYLMRGLLNAAQRWFDENSPAKWELYLRVLDLLSTVTQESYPYHIEKIDSNDTLYGSDPKFISEVNKISTKVLMEIVNQIKILGHEGQREKKSVLAFDLFIRMIVRADVSQPLFARIATDLYMECKKLGFVDEKFRARTFEYFKGSQCSTEVHNFLREYILVD